MTIGRWGTAALLAIAVSLAGGGGAALASPVSDHYARLGGPSGLLGPPLGSERSGPLDGRFREYRNGSIYYRPGAGAHEVHGAIRAEWLRRRPFEPRTDVSRLAYPLTDEYRTYNYGGTVPYSDFQGGSIAFRPGFNTSSLISRRCEAVFAPCQARWCFIGSCVDLPRVDHCDTHKVASHLKHSAEPALNLSDEVLGEVTTPLKKQTGIKGWRATRCIVHGAMGRPVRRAQFSTDGYYTIDLRITYMQLGDRIITSGDKKYIRLEIRPEHRYARSLVRAHRPTPGDTIAFGGSVIRDHTLHVKIKPFKIQVNEQYGFLEVHPDGEFAINPRLAPPPAPPPPNRGNPPPTD